MAKNGKMKWGFDYDEENDSLFVYLPEKNLVVLLS